VSKKTLTQSTVATNNIQSQPDQVVDQSTALKLAFDQYGIDSKQYNNVTLLAELADESPSNSGSNTIGHNSPGITANNVGDGLEELKDALDGIVLGQIPDNTLTEAKMAAEMKKQAGGVYPYNSGDTNATNIGTNANNVDILRTGATVGGSANAITLTSATASNFDFAIDLNPITFMPTANNTGAVTVNLDDHGVVSVLKPDGVGGTTALEADDLVDGVPATFYRRVSGNFFLFSPKGGADVIKSEQTGTFTSGSAATFDLTIAPVDVDASVVDVYVQGVVLGADINLFRVKLINSTTVRVIRGGTGTMSTINLAYQVTEYVKENVKSKQELDFTITTTAHIIPISSVDINKAILSASLSSGSTSANLQDGTYRYYYNNSTGVWFWYPGSLSGTVITTLQVIEFN